MHTDHDRTVYYLIATYQSSVYIQGILTGIKRIKESKYSIANKEYG